jgi:hypothetical protein
MIEAVYSRRLKRNAAEAACYKSKELGGFSLSRMARFHPASTGDKSLAMIPWMRLASSMMLLGFEAQRVVLLRMIEVATGGAHRPS